jgi:hypothetical protein
MVKEGLLFLKKEAKNFYFPRQLRDTGTGLQRGSGNGK